MRLNLTAGLAQEELISSPFQCQPTSNESGLVYTPSIPDEYFNTTFAASLRLSQLQGGTSIFFPISSEAANKTCIGTVVAIQYCHRASEFVVQMESRGLVAHLVILSNQGDYQFTRNQFIFLRDTPTTRTCRFSSVQYQYVCCAVNLLTRDETFQISPNVTIGIQSSHSNSLLAITGPDLVNPVERFESLGPLKSIYNFNQSNYQNSSYLPLLRLLTGKMSRCSYSLQIALLAIN